MSFTFFLFSLASLRFCAGLRDGGRGGEVAVDRI